MKIIVTGHKGFLGSSLIRKLNFSNEIIGISRNLSSPNYNIKEYLPSELMFIKESPDVVIMCHAAISSGNLLLDNQLLFDSNVAFTSDLIKRFPKAYFLYISTISVYGFQNDVINEKSLISPISEYAISKVWGEKIVSNSKRFGILRLSSLYGSNMKENTIIPNYVSQALENGTIEVWGNGERKQNYFHISDAVSYIEKIIKNQKQGFFLGTSSKEFSNIELANYICNEIKASVKFVNSDNTKSMAFENKFTREELDITSEKDFHLGIKEYVHWKQKQS
jgi:UDP-glucose 4-epimerase